MKYWLIICFSILTWSASAQTVLTLRDAQSKETIPGVVVKIQGSSNQISDQNGQVSLDISSTVAITFSHIAYQPFTAQVDPNLGEKDIFLSPALNSLGEVIVQGFESERAITHQAGAISKVREMELYRFNENSFLSAFNTKPGIRVEERSPASVRISIRGSALRSPFGVRNVKVYWNDVPYTAPDGTTAMNLLDLSNIQNTEIIKGPAGSIFGAGNGGVISMESRKQVEQNLVSTDFGMGDFGLRRYRIGVDQKTEKGGVSASFVSQKSDGYREHSAMDRKVFQLALHTNPSEKQLLSTQILYADLFYQIPGALNQTQVNENRQQARPGSVAQNSSIAQKTLYGTLSHRYRFSENIQNTTALYINTNDFENPFILDYKKETGFSYGGRTKFNFEDRWGSMPVRFVLGAEYQLGKTSAQNFGNRGGQADTIRFSDELLTTQAFLFQQFEIDWTQKLIMTLGFSENFTRYNINRTVDAGPNDPSNNTKKFDPAFIPRLAFVYKLNELSGVHASVSSGFSPPTVAEVRTNEGSINLDLQAERGINYELGYRSSIGIFNLDATAFYFRLSETITSYTNNQGVVLFRNAGATDQKGIEVSLDYALLRNQNTNIQELKLAHIFTGHYFYFADYQSGGNDFSGNQLTGVAPNSLVNILDLRSKLGLYANVTHHYVDAIPLNDANTVFQESYNLVGARLGWRYLLGASWNLEIYGGVDNLLDEAYSLGNDLNALAGRFYQPAPGRNYYGGLKLGFRY
jgi:iron complex outermembrane receptor protein